MQRFSRAGQSPLVYLSGQVREQLCRSDYSSKGRRKFGGDVGVAYVPVSPLLALGPSSSGANSTSLSLRASGRDWVVSLTRRRESKHPPRTKLVEKHCLLRHSKRT